MKNYLSFVLISFACLSKLEAQSQERFPESFPVESTIYNRDAITAESKNSVMPPPLKLNNLEKSDFNSDSVEYKSGELEISPETASFRTGANGKNPDMFSQLTTEDKITPISNYIENKKEDEKWYDWDSLILLFILGVVILIATTYIFTNKDITNNSSNYIPHSYTDELVFEYQKSKFTNELAFKSIALAKGHVFIDRFELTIYPYISYSGVYTIIKSQKVKTGVLNTVVKNDNTNETLNNFQKTYFIHLSESGDTMKIFDENRIGIILNF
ncbi:MAG: hypothetical protein EOO96_07660 [Pedobacter sp.]|nr:MAG: hypothetical protein EOO96_07660 [Pedobacter sp.]